MPDFGRVSVKVRCVPESTRPAEPSRVPSSPVTKRPTYRTNRGREARHKIFCAASRYRGDTNLSLGSHSGYTKVRPGGFTLPHGGKVDQADYERRLVAGAVDRFGEAEGNLRGSEVARLTWGLATILSMPHPKTLGDRGCTVLYGDELVAWGRKLLTLGPDEMIARFKDCTTKLVQLGVNDLSPAAVSILDVERSLKEFFLPSRIVKKVSLRASVEASWAVGLQQSKRACAPMRKDKKSSALERQLELLTTSQVLEDGDLVTQVRRTVQEVLKEQPTWRLEETPIPAAPSVSATFESGRKDGGGLGFFARKFGELVPGERPGDVNLCCRRVGIPEPMKLRVVSAGTAVHYSRVSRYQPSLWGLLMKHPTFQLIGCPLTGRHIKGFWKRAKGLFGDGVVALSGDYSAATDNLNPRLVEVVVDELMTRAVDMDPLDKELFRRALTGHLICDPGQDPVPQRWGQLMGSPLSFPILCIVNAAVCRAAVEMQRPGKGNLSLRETGILINGDDCLVPCADPSGYIGWEKLARAAGLNPSPGKCFVSRSYAQLNSALYQGPQARYRPFVRVNLLWDLLTKGLEAGTSAFTSYTHPTKVGDRARALFCRDFSLKDRRWIRSTFRELNLGMIEESRPVPLHLHRDFGGLGVPYLLASRGRWRIGPSQRKLVSRVSSSPSESQSLKDRLANLKSSSLAEVSDVARTNAFERWVGTSITDYVRWVPKEDNPSSAAAPPTTLVLETYKRLIDESSGQKEAVRPRPDFQVRLHRVKNFWERLGKELKKFRPDHDLTESWVLDYAKNGLKVEPERVISTELGRLMPPGGCTIGWCRTLPEHRAVLLEDCHV